MPLFELSRDGQTSRIAIDAAELETVHLPVLHDLAARWHLRRGRYIAFLAGPPGAGKSLLVALWEELARQGFIRAPLQSLPMDGFHYPNRVLDTRSIVCDGATMPLRQIKGWPESFDLPALQKALAAINAGEPVAWPRYDRDRHDPVPGAIPVLAEGVLIVEGLYMLLDLPDWQPLRAEADYGIFLECPEAVFRDALLARRLKQGLRMEAALAHYQLVDRHAWRLATEHRHGVDRIIRVVPGRRLELVHL